MTLEVKKQERENSQSLIRRFSKRLQHSGLLKRARKKRFRAKIKSENMQQKAALRREELKQKYEQLKKMGKVK